MQRLRSPAVVALVIVLGGCAALHRRGSRLGDFGAPARLPDDAAALGHFFRGEMALAQNDPDTALGAFEADPAALPFDLFSTGQAYLWLGAFAAVDVPEVNPPS